MSRVLRIIVVMLAWSVAHSACAALYTHLCAPFTPIGVLLSPFVMASPQCTALRWVMQQGVSRVDYLWVILGTVLSQTVGVVVE